MLINVSTLLQEPVGSARDYALDEEPVVVSEAGYARIVSGRVHLIRSERGILVAADLSLEAALECARCLEDYDQPLEIRFDEEYVLPYDPLTGEPRADLEPDDFRIDDRRHLDLSEAVRQYEQSALPMLPVCRAECRGLCPQCGQNLNEATCDCAPQAIDDRWGPLAALAERLHTEDDDGTPEA